MNMNFIVFIFSLEICHILSDRYALKESDLTVEGENIEKKNVYLLLNLDGSLPMPGKIKSLSVKKNIPEPWSTIYSHHEQVELKKNNKLTTISLLPLQWTITFDFMPGKKGRRKKNGHLTVSFS